MLRIFTFCLATILSSTLASTLASALASANQSDRLTAPAFSADKDRCHSADPGFLCLGIKYVTFTGGAAITEEQSRQTVRETNRLWAQCQIGFQIDEFLAVSSHELGIRSRIGDYTELDDVRSAFADEHRLLVAVTGRWDRSGSLGDTAANAWTSMPGGPPYGAILEQSVGTFSNIVAHELGHYLNLYHLNDSADLMNPTIYSTSRKLTSGQCEIARQTVASNWRGMLR